MRISDWSSVCALPIYPNLYDVERVEFLRGPQGTLFGSNSLAGAMRIITKSPDLDDFEASASVDLGLTGSSAVRQRYNAMVNLPIMKDEIGLRVTGYYRRSEEHTSELQSLMRISYAVF